jgi:hypothetical protein
MQYHLPLANSGTKPHQIKFRHRFVALAQILAGCFIFAFQKDIQILGILMAADGLGIFLLSVFASKQFVRPHYNLWLSIYELAIAMIAAIYFLTQKNFSPTAIFTAMSIYIAYALMNDHLLNTRSIYIGEKGIKNPYSARNRFIGWEEIEDFAFKFNTVTVNCLDNRMYQWDVLPFHGDTETVEQFCEKQILTHHEKRIQNNW